MGVTICLKNCVAFEKFLSSLLWCDVDWEEHETAKFEMGRSKNDACRELALWHQRGEFDWVPKELFRDVRNMELQTVAIPHRFNPRSMVDVFVCPECQRRCPCARNLQDHINAAHTFSSKFEKSLARRHAYRFCEWCLHRMENSFYLHFHQTYKCDRRALPPEHCRVCSYVVDRCQDIHEEGKHHKFVISLLENNNQWPRMKPQIKSARSAMIPGIS